MTLELNLKFALRSCSRCGSEGLVAFPCESCGLAEVEEDPFVAARQQQVRAAREQAATKRADDNPLSLED
jgi:hypothetical protein